MFLYFDGQIITEIQSIAWENVSFRYTSHDESPGAKVLDEATMRWNKGDKILLMGKSGSGKTTIIRLLCKYFDDYEGSLKINSIELKQISRKSLCSQIGVIPQKPYVFNDTIWNNICLHQGFSESEVRAAIKRAGLSNYIDSLPEGLDSMIVENGKNLSGGQAQRIAIARALLRKRGILIMDEGTAGLDYATAGSIIEGLLETDCTLIMITHDIHSDYISRFPKRYAVADGRVTVERGDC